MVTLISGCAVQTREYSSSSVMYTNGTGTIHYSYGNGYWYDNNYDYYDGLYGEYRGGLFYVVRSDGSRHPAPPPRYPNHRFTQKGWPGYNPVGKGPWTLNNYGSRPMQPHPPKYNVRPPSPPVHKPLPPNINRPGTNNGPFKNPSQNVGPRSPQHLNYDKDFNRPLNSNNFNR